MIYVKLMGGLGNQMFQYAFARAYSLKNKVSFCLDLSFYDDSKKLKDVTPRNYELDVFRCDPNLTLKEPYVFFKNPYLKKIERRLRVKHFVREEGHGFNASLLEPRDEVLFEGWFQSDKYFEAIRPLLLATFVPRKGLSLKTQRLISRAKETESLSLHFRRGDYIQHEAFHGTCSLDYYKRSVAYFLKQGMKPVFFIFSDDMEWVKREFPLLGEVHYVEHNQGASSYEDLMIMASCQHNIIANSSFSWWGAWLNQNPEKIVVAPERWFSHEVGSPDRVPSSWLRF